MSCPVVKFMEERLCNLTELPLESIKKESLAALGFSSNDFSGIWNEAMEKFPGLKDQKFTLWSLEKPVGPQLKMTAEELKDFRP